MTISRLRLKNWRNFRTLDLQFADRVFLIGPNASGKSNLLDVFRFLRDLSQPGGGLQPAIEKRGGLSKVRCLTARREPDVEIDVEVSEDGESAAWRYAIGIKQQVRGFRQPILGFERVWKQGKLIVDRPDKADSADNLRLTQTYLEQINANAEFRDLPRFFESFRYLHLVPQLLRHPESYQASSAADDPFGRGFLETVARTPEKTRRSRLKKIEEALRKAVPQLTDLTDTKDEAGVPHLEATYAHWRPNAGKQREDQFSDGTLRLIGLFWSLLDGDAPLLLEEPELSLHTDIVRKLPGLLASLHRKRRRQVFVSTHSAELLTPRSIDAREVVMLRPGQDGTVAETAASNREIVAMLAAGLSIADAVLPRTGPAEIDQLELFR